MDDEQEMGPGECFVAEECGCAFTVQSGPRDETMVKQALQCCCGHEMKKPVATARAAA